VAVVQRDARAVEEIFQTQAPGLEASPDQFKELRKARKSINAVRVQSCSAFANILTPNENKYSAMTLTSVARDVAPRVILAQTFSKIFNNPLKYMVSPAGFERATY
jgi:hypothetical protein